MGIKGITLEYEINLVAIIHIFLIQNDKSCSTDSGPSPFHPCKFPFEFGGNVYTSCTKDPNPSTFKVPFTNYVT